MSIINEIFIAWFIFNCIVSCIDYHGFMYTLTKDPLPKKYGELIDKFQIKDPKTDKVITTSNIAKQNRKKLNMLVSSHKLLKVLFHISKTMSKYICNFVWAVLGIFACSDPHLSILGWALVILTGVLFIILTITRDWITTIIYNNL